MMAVTFDTLIYSKKLREVGVPENVAEIHAEALSGVIEDHLATKKDLVNWRRDLMHKIDRLGYKLTIRLGGMLVAGILVLAAIVKF